MKRNTEHLHVKVLPETSAKLRSWSSELGFTLGETIDFLAREYEEQCDRPDGTFVTHEELSSALSDMLERLKDTMGHDKGEA